MYITHQPRLGYWAEKIYPDLGQSWGTVVDLIIGGLVVWLLLSFLAPSRPKSQYIPLGMIRLMPEKEFLASAKKKK